jgi:hypothetical protein
MAAATVLESYFGKDYAFEDTSVLEFNIPKRSFSSLQAASREAGYSRFYGGIHYTVSVEQGLIDGKKVGEEILANMKLRTTK